MKRDNKLLTLELSLNAFANGFLLGMCNFYCALVNLSVKLWNISCSASMQEKKLYRRRKKKIQNT